MIEQDNELLTQDENASVAPQEAEAPSPQEVDEPEGDAGDSSPPQAPASRTPTVEDLAAEQGWAPKEQWRGPPEAWRPADQYIRRGAEIQRELKQRLEREKAEFNWRVDRVQKAAEKTIQWQMQQVATDYDNRARAAAAVGDVDTFDKVNAEKNARLWQMQQEAADAMPPIPPFGEERQPRQNIPTAIIEFAERNKDWFRVDAAMTNAAVGKYGELEQRYPNADPAALADLTEKYIHETFRRQPAAQQPRSERPSAPTVEGGLRTVRTAVKKGFDALPQEAKQSFRRFYEQGTYGKMPEDKARADYAQKYWDQ